jgi:transposase InsO family protein
MAEQRIEFVIRAASGKEQMAALCREFSIARPTGYRWRKRFEQGSSVTAVVEGSRRPAHSPQRTELRMEERVVALREKHGWGAKKLADLLAKAGDPMTVITINRILKRRGLVSKWDSHPPALQRFERHEPNELWQMDGKGKYGSKDGTCYPLSLLDDHSRYAVGLFALPAFTAQLIYPCLVRTFEQHGVPEAMLMDRGSVWWSTMNGYGLTWLSVALIEQGIGLHYGRVHHPQTQGKVERFHRTLNDAMRHRGKPEYMAEWPETLEEFRRSYNEVRPHEALGMKCPVERYRVSVRSYQPRPREWTYPEGSVVKRLNPQGFLYWQGENWFVCEALAGKFVRVESVAGLLLVSYRHMYVREIDRPKHCTRSLVIPLEGRA